MADTPTSLAAELRRLNASRVDADAELRSRINSALTAHDEATQALSADMDRLAARVEALPGAPGWRPRFPGDTRPGTIRWGQGGGNDSARADEHERVAGVPMGAWRLFYRMSQIGSAVAKCAEAVGKGRVPVLSMKPSTSWATAAAGGMDAQLRDLFARLGALDGPVWFILHHEPEGGGASGNAPDDPGGAPAWRSMQERCAHVLRDSGASNIAFGPCLMVWTWSTDSGRNPEDWWVPGIWDFYGADLYQSKESGPAPVAQDSWLRFVAWCEGKGLPVVLGELGNRGSDATAGAELRETYEFLTQIDCVGCTYFDTALNSGPVPYTLVGEPLKVFRELMRDPRSVHLGNP